MVLWGRADTLPPAAAALVNGTAAHALELDDFGGCGHSGAVVIPAVCALAQRMRAAAGATCILAIAAGYDLAGRVLEGSGGYRPHNERGWHSTGTCGSFGAAAAAARLLGASRRTVHACARHRRHFHRRHLGFSGRRRAGQALPSGQGGGDRRQRRAARAGRPHRAAPRARCAAGAASMRPTRPASRHPQQAVADWGASSTSCVPASSPTPAAAPSTPCIDAVLEIVGRRAAAPRSAP